MVRLFYTTSMVYRRCTFGYYNLYYFFLLGITHRCSRFYYGS
jgi:hypothetical protein